MNITIERNVQLSPSLLANLYITSGMIRPVHDIDRIRRMIEGADEVITAWDGQKLVGIVRAITDYAYCCYLSDVAIDSDYQKMGLGKRLIEHLREILGDGISYVLTSTTKSIGFYEHVGFERAHKAFWIVRKY